MSEPAHLASPMVFSGNGGASTVVQGSPQDLVTRAYNVCVCVLGTREDAPTFGIPDSTFTTAPLDVRELQEAIERSAETPVTVAQVEEAAGSAKITVEA